MSAAHPSDPHRIAVGVLTRADLAHLRHAVAIANHAAGCHVADRCVPVRLDSGTWLDTRPMLDPREVCGPSIDLAAAYLHYLETAGLATRHPGQRHLVRLRMPPAAGLAAPSDAA